MPGNDERKVRGGVKRASLRGVPNVRHTQCDCVTRGPRAYIQLMSANCCGHDHHHHRSQPAATPAIAACSGPCSPSTPSCSWSRSAPASRPAPPRCKPTRSISSAMPPTTPSACSSSAWRCAIAPMPRWRKGISMGVFGLWVIGTVIWHATHGTLPSAVTMGAVGVAAFAANAASFALLWAYRSGDANMRSAWICTRNDVDRQSRGAAGCGRRVRHRHGLARYCRSPPSWPGWRSRAPGP